MKRTGTCPKCGSNDVIGDAKAVDRSHGGAVLDMCVATYKKPEALIFKGMQQSTVSAWVCAGCGYVEYYADEPENLKL